MKTRVFFAPVLLAYAIACGGQTVPGAAVPMAHAEAAAIPLTEEEAVAAALARIHCHPRIVVHISLQ